MTRAEPIDHLRQDPPLVAARTMAQKDQRSDRCRISGAHVWHVLYIGKVNYPCGGGSTEIETQGSPA